MASAESCKLVTYKFTRCDIAVVWCGELNRRRMYQVHEECEPFEGETVAKSLSELCHEFLASRKHSKNVVDILNHFESGADTYHCLSTLQALFGKLIKRHSMIIHIEPLRPNIGSDENRYKHWLLNLYERAWLKMLDCFHHEHQKIRIHAVQCTMKLLACEVAHPLDGTHVVPHFKSFLNRLLLKDANNALLIDSFADCLIYDDIRFHAWKSLVPVTLRNNPPQPYVINYFTLLEKMTVPSGAVAHCWISEAFHYDEAVTRRCLNRIWDCVMLWGHSPATHRQLLFLLLDRVLPHLDKPLLMVDFLMDSLDCGGAISVLALQGVFAMIQTHHIDYPTIYTKLYSMFEPEIFHTKFKARLFYLSDMFLRSTHLPETMVAAFAKRLARLALVAPSQDVVVICGLIGNLILRHRGLKILINNTSSGLINEDPFIMEERDPMKSNAINSSLWELKTLQNHALPAVATATRFINQPLSSVECDITAFLDDALEDNFDMEMKRNQTLIASAFDRPDSSLAPIKHDVTSVYWQF